MEVSCELLAATPNKFQMEIKIAPARGHSLPGGSYKSFGFIGISVIIFISSIHMSRTLKETRVTTELELGHNS